MKFFEGTLRPMRAKLSAVTVEYGLHEGRFWLPKLNVAEGEFVAAFVRVPMKWEESFRYNSVNGRDSLPAVPGVEQAGKAPDDDAAWLFGGEVTIGSEGRPRHDLTPAERIAREDSIVRYSTRRADSLRALATEAREKGDTIRAKQLSASVSYYSSRARNITRRREACATDSTYYAGINTRYDGAVRAAVRMPCDLARLENSPDLPGLDLRTGETVFGSSELRRTRERARLHAAAWMGAAAAAVRDWTRVHALQSRRSALGRRRRVVDAGPGLHGERTRLRLRLSPTAYRISRSRSPVRTGAPR